MFEMFLLIEVHESSCLGFYIQKVHMGLETSCTDV